MNLCISLDIFGDSQINRVFLVSKMGIRDVFFNRDGSSWIQLHDWPFVEVNRDKYTIITTLLAPLTPPGGKKCNIHYYIFIPPQKYRGLAGGVKNVTGALHGGTPAMLHFPSPPMNSHGNTLGGGPQGVEIVTYLREVPKKYMLLFWVPPITPLQLYIADIALP